jgi:hypothetical protein
MAVVAIAGQHVIAFVVNRRAETDCHGFLAVVQVAEAAYLPQAVHLAGFFLEAPYPHHVVTQFPSEFYVPLAHRAASTSVTAPSAGR